MRESGTRLLVEYRVRLDRETEAVAFQADPDAALRGLPEPVLLDEWPVVPGVLGAVKRSVDAQPSPGAPEVGHQSGDARDPVPGVGTTLGSAGRPCSVISASRIDAHSIPSSARKSPRRPRYGRSSPV